MTGWPIVLGFIALFDVVLVCVAPEGSRAVVGRWTFGWSLLMCLGYAMWRYEWLHSLVLIALGRR